MPFRPGRYSRIITAIIITSIILSACSIYNQNTALPQATQTGSTSPNPGVQVEVIFTAKIPPDTPPDSKILVDILDELTGLALNPLRYTMVKQDETHFKVHIAVPLNSTIKYRYLRGGGPPAPEYNPGGKQVRYRLHHVTGPVEIQDIISAWIDVPFSGKWGRIQGRITDENNVPVPNIFVTAGGEQTVSSSDGYFLIESLPPGIHNLVAYALDGKYQTFQQGAQVAEDATTPAAIKLQQNKNVKITFIVNAPPETHLYLDNMTVRIVGNLYGFGNTFADLGGGINSTALQARPMQLQEDGRYALAVDLPAGSFFSYKYSLGDGFWNSEQTADGRFYKREIIVPDQDQVIEDNIEKWSPDGWGPVYFSVKTPEDSDPQDTVFIQFNPYGWTEPIPMMRAGNREWNYVLFSPLHILGPVHYRYCRNSQCDSDAVAQYAGSDSTGRQFIPLTEPQVFRDEIVSWKWGQKPADYPVDTSIEVVPLGSEFWAGFELSAKYQPSWLSYFAPAVVNLQSSSANWIVMTPTWSYTNQNLPVLEPVPGKDLLWPDLINWNAVAHAANLNVALFPQVNYPQEAGEWWPGTVRDRSWWVSWYDRYREYLLNYADLAKETQAGALIIGGPQVLPSLPEGILPDGSSSLPLPEAEAIWSVLISDVRSRYDGTLLWAINFPSELNRLPQFVDQVDGLYVLWNAGLSETSNASLEDLTIQAGKILDDDLLPLKEQTNKPVILALKYAAVDGAMMGCTDHLGNCLSFDVLDQPSSVVVQPDFIEQAEIYQAMFTSINGRPWINGIISRGFFPPLTLYDASSSTIGKPVENIIHYWFQRFITKTQ